MPIGEAMFTQRSIRRFRPDPIPDDDLHLIIEAAVKAPNGGNNQIGRFLVLTDRERIREFGALYREAWWAKRRDERGWRGPRASGSASLAERSSLSPAGSPSRRRCREHP
jgi:nitroreductase